MKTNKYHLSASSICILALPLEGLTALAWSCKCFTAINKPEHLAEANPTTKKKKKKAVVCVLRRKEGGAAQRLELRF